MLWVAQIQGRISVMNVSGTAATITRGSSDVQTNQKCEMPVISRDLINNK